MRIKECSPLANRLAPATDRSHPTSRFRGLVLFACALLVGGASSCATNDTLSGGQQQPATVKPAEPVKVLSAAELTEIAGRLEQAKQLTAAGRITEPAGGSALDQYRAILAIDPVNPAALSNIAALSKRYREQAIAANQSGRYSDALTSARRAESIGPKNPDHADQVAIAHAGLEQWSEAAAANIRAIELGSQTGAEKRLGANYYYQGKYRLAAATLEKAVQAHPKDIEAHKLLGLTYQNAGQLPLAEQALFRAYRSAGKDQRADIALTLGRVYMAMGKYSIAASFLEEAADVHFRDRQVYEDLATVHDKTGNNRRWLEVTAMRALLDSMDAGAAFRPLAESRAAGIRALVEKRFASAILYDLLEPAERGDAESAYLMARVYHQGYGSVPKDLKQARYWYMEAGKRGHAGAQTGVGHMYLNGLGGLQRDVVRAANWFKRAAVQSEPGAMARLGLMYERGDGVPQNSKTASYYLVLAAEAGDATARRRLTELGTWPFESSAGEKTKPTISGGIGELPPLMVMSTGGLVAVTDRAAEPIEVKKSADTNKGTPVRKKKSCGGGLAALGCAFD